MRRLDGGTLARSASLRPDEKASCTDPEPPQPLTPGVPTPTNNLQMSEAITHSPPGGALDAAIERRCDTYFSFLAHLVREPSLAGGRPAQSSSQRIRALGFAARWIELTEGMSDPRRGPDRTCHGHTVLVGERIVATSSFLNGRIDVVPPATHHFRRPPSHPTSPTVGCGPRRRGHEGRGWPWHCSPWVHCMTPTRAKRSPDLGRRTRRGEPRQRHSTSILDGVRGDVAVFPAPTDLAVLVSGVGVLWCAITVHGGGAHAGGGRESPPS